MTRTKPAIHRYFINLKTNEICHISGFIQAVNRVIHSEWPKQKVVVKRISKSEYMKNTHFPCFGLEYNYHPISTVAKDKRLKINRAFHKMSFQYHEQ